MKEFRNPVFDLGIAGIVLFLVGVFVLSSNQHYGYIIMFTGLTLGILFTIINIIEIARSKELRGQKKITWIIIVFLVPVLGGFIYYIFSRDNQRKTIG